MPYNTLPLIESLSRVFPFIVGLGVNAPEIKQVVMRQDAELDPVILIIKFCFTCVSMLAASLFVYYAKPKIIKWINSLKKPKKI